MSKPTLPPIQENFEIPADVQEQMRRIQLLTPEDRKALIEAQRQRDPGEQVPFSVMQRRRMLRDLQRGRYKKLE